MKKTILVILVAIMLLISNGTASAQTVEQQKKQLITNALLKGPNGNRIRNSVKIYSKKYGVEESLVLAIIMTESGFNVRSKSKYGCSGLMQLNPTTFRARNVGKDIFSIDTNIHAGTKHIAGLLGRHKGNVYLALASYNLGGGRVPIKGNVPKAGKPYVNKVMYNKKIIESVL